ncbi:MAG: CHASE domain-containing protein [Novosphingobium sp.]|nr:CHASE domain-containing protein [Novosphingobium sp.]
MRFPRAVPLSVFLLVAAVTGLSVFSIEKVEGERAATQHAEASRALAFSLERRANSHIGYLRAVAVLLGSPEPIDGAKFRQYAAQLRQDDTTTGAEGIGWAERVDRSRIGEFEAQMRAAGQPDFTIHPPLASDAAFAVPVTYILPDTPRNRRALGYDMHSDPMRRLAMAKADKDGKPTATGKLVLVQEGPGGTKPGFIIYMPVYTGDTGSLKGFVYAPFTAQSFLDSALPSLQHREVGVRLYDETDQPDRLLAAKGRQDLSGPHYDTPVEIANRPFVVSLIAPPLPFLSEMSLLALAAGLVVASLLSTIAWLVTRQAAEDRMALSWLEEQASIRNSLTRELNHRVKNTLANVLSIIALTRRRETDLDTFADNLSGRIRALSATHDLLTNSNWGATPVRAVIDAELAPYVKWGDHSVVAHGPEVELAPNDALSLGLALHELATNASKFGALSAPGGRVEVRWQMIAPGLARIEWSEHGGPPVADQRRRGFGLDLIEKIVAHELRNPVDLRFDKDGVRCTLIVPVRAPAVFRMRARQAAMEVKRNGTTPSNGAAPDGAARKARAS